MVVANQAGDGQPVLFVPHDHDFSIQPFAFSLRSVNGYDVAVMQERHHGVSPDLQTKGMFRIRTPLFGGGNHAVWHLLFKIHNIVALIAVRARYDFQKGNGYQLVYLLLGAASRVHHREGS